MDINELHSFKLSDAVKFHTKLNPKLWKNDQLDPLVRDQLLVIAKDFVSQLGVGDLDVVDVTISGSNAAFSYTPHSDLDLHVVVNMSKLHDDEVYQELFRAKKTLYNDSHDITVHGIPVELYAQNAAEPVVSLGEYSLLHDKWIKIPKRKTANLDQNATKAKYDQLTDLISLAVKTKDEDRVNKAIKLIKRYRQAGLDTGGEFSPENLAYKAIRAQGGIDDLYAVRDSLHSKKLSIEEDDQLLDKPTLTVDELARKHGVDRMSIAKQLDKGIKVELEHTSHKDIAREIALDHISEDPKYYDKLAKASLEEQTLTELADAPYPYTLTSSGPHMLEYQFTAANNIKYIVELKVMYGGVSLRFHAAGQSSNDDRFRITKTGDSIKVMSTIATILRSYIKENSPSSISFGCYADEPTKVKLYTSMAKRLSKEFPYEVGGPYSYRDPTYGNSVGFRLTKKKQQSGNVNKDSGYIPNSAQKNDPVLSLVDKARERMGEDALYGGNCGMFSLALAKKLKEDGIPVTLGLLFNDANNLGTPSDIVANEADLYHVVVEYNGKYYDGTGVVTPNTLLDIAKDQYGDDNPGWFTDADPFDPSVQRVIRSETNWNKPASTFYQALTEASGYIPSNSQKNDPRFKTALTVDVKPNAIKKNAKAFGWLTSRAGIPPQANPNGKI